MNLLRMPSLESLMSTSFLYFCEFFFFLINTYKLISHSIPKHITPTENARS